MRRLLAVVLTLATILTACSGSDVSPEAFGDGPTIAQLEAERDAVVERVAELEVAAAQASTSEEPQLAEPEQGGIEAGPTSEPAQTSSKPSAFDNGLPSTWLGIGSGSIKLFDTVSGEATRDFGGLGTSDDSETQTESDVETLTEGFVERAWVVNDLGDIYAVVCCEPVGGHGLLVNDSTPLNTWVPVISGFAAVPSSDRLRVAIPTQVGLRINDSEPYQGGFSVSETSSQWRATASWIHGTESIVWGPTGPVSDPKYENVTISDNPVVRSSYAISALSDVSLASGHGGTLLAAGCSDGPEPAGSGMCNKSLLLTLDPITGQILETRPIEAGSVLGGFDQSGLYLIYVDGNQIVRWTGPDGAAGILGSGQSWAVWA